MSKKNVTDNVKEYYGKTLKNSDDLKTSACCTIGSYPTYMQEKIKNIHPEVIEKYYGCGLTIPLELTGAHVLDLGSGSGRDCYLLSQLVGENGAVVGVDMTDEQLDVANRHRDFHREKFNHARSNVTFLKGEIENLAALDLSDNTFDCIVSNCVINLSPDKLQVLQEAFRVLKLGGEMYFSDVYSDRRIPSHLIDDRELYGECLSGALYDRDFIALAKQAGFGDPRMVETREIELSQESIKNKVGAIKFYSTTYRLFKVDDLEETQEDYGQTVCYKGNLPHAASEFILDSTNTFKSGETTPVSGNTFSLLWHSRFKQYFDFTGNHQTHHGGFNQNAKPSKSGPSKCC